MVDIEAAKVAPRLAFDEKGESLRRSVPVGRSGAGDVAERLKAAVC
jgi:hypothetical protein